MVSSDRPSENGLSPLDSRELARDNLIFGSIASDFPTRGGCLWLSFELPSKKGSYTPKKDSTLQKRLGVIFNNHGQNFKTADFRPTKPVRGLKSPSQRPCPVGSSGSSGGAGGGGHRPAPESVQALHRADLRDHRAGALVSGGGWFPQLQVESQSGNQKVTCNSEPKSKGPEKYRGGPLGTSRARFGSLRFLHLTASHARIRQEPHAVKLAVAHSSPDFAEARRESMAEMSITHPERRACNLILEFGKIPLPGFKET